jgi:hypothetical protein
MAQKAWATEREPADALLFARAAIESGAPEQATALLHWQSATGYREPELDGLIRQIQQAVAAQKK